MQEEESEMSVGGRNAQDEEADTLVEETFVQ